MSLRRFIARRGTPTVIYSDNGTNFVGANREIQECLNGWNQDKIAGALSKERIQWVFNPPVAPHMGGVCERLVRSCKKSLNVVLQNQVLTDEVFLTAITEVESLINSRPLTEVSSDANDLEALTPNHFLIVVYCLYRLSEDTEFFPDDVQKIDWSELVFLVERVQEQEIGGKIYVCVLSFLFVLFCSFPFKM